MHQVSQYVQQPVVGTELILCPPCVLLKENSCSGFQRCLECTENYQYMDPFLGGSNVVVLVNILMQNLS